MFRSKKKKNNNNLSCPFCGELVEDVSQHVLDCSGVHGAVKDLSTQAINHSNMSNSAPDVAPAASTTNSGPAPPTRARSARDNVPVPQVTTVQKSETESSLTNSAPNVNIVPERPLPPGPSPRGNKPTPVPIAERALPPKPRPPLEKNTKPTGWVRPDIPKQEHTPPQPVVQQPQEPVVAPVEEPEEEEEGEVEFPPATIVFDYDAGSEVEISVKKGQEVLVLDDSDPEWMYIGFDGLEGFVPTTFVKLIEQPPLPQVNKSPVKQPPVVPQPTNVNVTNEPARTLPTPGNVETKPTETPVIQKTPSPEKPVQVETPIKPLAAANSGSKLQVSPRGVPPPRHNPYDGKPQQRATSEYTPSTGGTPPSLRPAKPSKKQSKIGSISISTLRSRKKKKPMEFTIERADTGPVISSPPAATPSPATPTSNPAESDGFAISAPGNIENASPVAVNPPPVDNADQRTKIAREILSTETNYVNIIQAMINRYRETLLYRLEAYSNNITREMIMEIFINLEMIIPINEQLCKDIQKVVDDWSDSSTIGDIFVRVAPFMKMYNQYSNRYDQALATLGRCMKNEEFALLVEEIDGTTKLGSRLESLLIAPIQRIPRYSLLLQELRKSTPQDHPDIAHLDKAIPLVQQVANYINSNMSEVENQEKLLELSLAGAQSLLKPHRVLLQEAVVLEGKKKVHIWLFNDILVQIPDNLSKHKENLNKPEYQWPLHLIWLGDTSVKKTQATWSVTGPTKTYTFTCLIDEATQWVNKITTAIKQHLEYLSVTQDVELEQEKNAAMTFENPNRFGTFEFPNKAKYTGWWKDGEFQGKGTFTFFSSVYVGGFNKSLKEGKGVLNYVTGEVYDGDFVEDKQHGQGILTYPNGDVYTGGWVDGLKHGEGSLTCNLGSSYVGSWANDQPQGLGEMTYSSGMTYNGNWENGMRHHYGILTSPTGERYEGEWINGVRNGKGKMEYFEGCYYDGQWKDGFYNGKGVYVCPTGTYDGEYVIDQKEGTGTLTYANGKVYKGQWKKNMYHGTGTLTYPSGLIECYTGEWQANRRHGNGILRFFNGDLYEGHFKDNRFHGSGTYSFGNGITIKCKFSKGNISGEVVFTRPLRPDDKKKDNTYTGTYKDGMLISSDRPPIYIPTIPIGEIDLM